MVIFSKPNCLNMSSNCEKFCRAFLMSLIISRPSKTNMIGKVINILRLRLAPSRTAKLPIITGIKNRESILRIMLLLVFIFM